MCFQAIVAALVYLTAVCDGLTSGYSATLLHQLRANSSGFEADEESESWIGKSRDLFYLHTQVNLPHNGAIDLYGFLSLNPGSYKLNFGSCPIVSEVRKYNTRI
jgi:hypothetical protein